MDKLTNQQAYLAMFAFLEKQYRLSKSDDIGALLGSMSLLADGMPADSAVLKDWQKSVTAALNGQIDASMRSRS